MGSVGLVSGPSRRKEMGLEIMVGAAGLETGGVAAAPEVVRINPRARLHGMAFTAAVQPGARASGARPGRLMLTMKPNPFAVKEPTRRGCNRNYRSTEARRTAARPCEGPTVGVGGQPRWRMDGCIFRGFSVGHRGCPLTGTPRPTGSAYARSTTHRKPTVAHRSRPAQIRRNFTLKLQGRGPPSMYHPDPAAV
jgi:hypothetical protein